MKETPLNYGLPQSAAPQQEPLTTHFKPSSMERKALLTTVKEAFDASPNTKELFVTNDGMCFVRQHDARNHQKHLGPHNSGVEKMAREDVATELKGGKGKRVLPPAEENEGVLLTA